MRTLLAAAAITIAGCTPSPSSSGQSSGALAVPPMDGSAPANTARPPEVSGHVRYDLVISDGDATTTRLAFGASDTSPTTLMVGKNVVLATGGRSDVGSNLKAQLKMQGQTPVLDLHASLAFVPLDTSKVQRIAVTGATPTPLGAPTVIGETSQDGRKVRVTATPTADVALGPVAPAGNFIVDAKVTHTGSDKSEKTTSLELKISGDAPATARQIETVPLRVVDGGISPRQDVGTRIKLTARPHTDGLDLDFDLELSAQEPTAPHVAIRKVIVRSMVVVPFDKPVQTFTAEEDGHRYEVVLTARRAR